MPVMLDDLHMVALRGDINGNSIPFETEDYTSYFNYFFFDTSAFQGHVAQSIENSDVNLDGKTLTVADLLYLWRVIEGDSLPYPEPVDSDVHATFYQPGGTIGQLTGEFPDSLGAVYFVLDGSSSNLCFYEYECHWYYDGTNTRVLLAPTIPGEPVTAILPGWIIGYGTMWDVHHIIRAEAATYDGAVMPAELGTWLDVPEDNTSLPRTFALHQNYPNPFNAGTVISFDLPRAADVRLEVLNIAGQVVYEVNRHYAAGSHEIEWDGTVSGRSVASGVYYYRISAGEFTATKKMVLLK